jgi:uncharacterized membrane protein (DUF4010 family)
MPQRFDLELVKSFAIALLIGALVGIEREKRKSDDPDRGMSGLRTFILVALIGAICGWLVKSLNTPTILAAVLLLVAALLLSGHVLAARVNPRSLGLTTEFAVIAVCLLGALTTLGSLEAAVALGIVTAAVLAYKQPLHGLVDKLGWDDIFAGLRLLIATFIVLPLLPDRPLDPWGALNPFKLWVLVLLISGLSLVGYVATRWLGSEKGPVLTGLTGGLVSSTAVTLFFARESGDAKSGASGALAAGILLAWSVMFVRVIVIVAFANRALVKPLLIPFAVMLLAAAGPAGYYYWRSVRQQGGGRGRGAEVPLRNPFGLAEAAKFAAFFAAILLVVKIVQHYSPGEGMYLVAAIAGTTDVDAITLSMAGYAKEADPHIAVEAIIIASLVNTLVKCGMVVGFGGASLRSPILIATGAILAAGIAAIVLW